MSEKNIETTLETRIESAEQAEGIKLKDIKVGEKYIINTQNTKYLLEYREDGFYLSGNKKYCPTPRKVQINGSTWGGRNIMTGFIGIGMYMEIASIQGYDINGDNVTTSKIETIEKVGKED